MKRETQQFPESLETFVIDYNSQRVLKHEPLDVNWTPQFLFSAPFDRPGKAIKFENRDEFPVQTYP
jgi:hypothetical protein